MVQEVEVLGAAPASRANQQQVLQMARGACWKPVQHDVQFGLAESAAEYVNHCFSFRSRCGILC